MKISLILKRVWGSFCWRMEKYVLVHLRALGALLIPAGRNQPYEFERARNYWHFVPRAKGASPFHTVGLGDLTDEELIQEFDKEMEIARKKPERKMGFARAIESITGIEGPRVMDYGSGIGFYGLFILTSHPKAKVTFADINAENLTAIERITKAKNLTARSAFALVTDPAADSLEFAQPFDLIVSMGVLHHTPYAPQIVRNLTRFLKVGGVFEVMLYNYHYLKQTEKLSGHRLNYSGFGAVTDPSMGELANPYSEPYDDTKAQRLFDGYELLTADYPDPCYNTYCFRKL